MGWITRVHSIRCNVPPLFPFNREPASPDKATCNLSQLVLFTVSRFSGSVLYLSPIDPLSHSYPSIFPPQLPYSAFFIPYFAFLEPRIEWGELCVCLCVCVCACVCPTFAATGKVYNRPRLTERSNIVSADRLNRIHDEKGHGYAINDHKIGGEDDKRVEKEDSNSSIPFKEKSKERDNETSSNDRRILMKASDVTSKKVVWRWLN